ncbi:MAG: NADH-quinone oxidoreductase subunit NuoE [Gammaproteobacteria bacterium]|nr:NADH-quinone oxidoreductase subunit NuoE [Gammaproteobacteria bacterium]
MLSETSLKAIAREVAKYPVDRKQAAVMAALRIGQEEKGWLSDELIAYIAKHLELQPIQVLEVATFYTMYDLEPVGRHKVSLCTNISCMLRGSDEILMHVKEKLGIEVGETTADGRFTLKEVECLAACGGAPMMQVGEEYYENLTPERVDVILDGLE